MIGHPHLSHGSWERQMQSRPVDSLLLNIMLLSHLIPEFMVYGSHPWHMVVHDLIAVHKQPENLVSSQLKTLEKVSEPLTKYKCPTEAPSALPSAAAQSMPALKILTPLC